MNHGIRVPDLELYPTAADVAGALTSDWSGPDQYLAMKTDVSKAHRRVPVSPLDWGLQTCAIEDKPTGCLDSWEVWVNTVGTYGIGSASWHWGRVGALCLRLILCATGVRFGFRFADDYLFLCRAVSGKTLMPFFRILLLFAIMEVPLKWAKTAGGRHIEWIGYMFDFENLQMGLSRKRAAWVAKWLDQAAQDALVSIREMMGAVGRIGFAAEVLRGLKPFMAPLYAWLSASSTSAVLALPPALILLAKWMAKKIQEERMVPMRKRAPDLGEWFRADAKAEGMLVVVGGWESRNSNGSTAGAKWFSVDLTPTSAPWAFCKGMPFRTIASLELFATLLCVMAFADGLPGEGTVCLRLRGITDNQGNEGAMKKHMTTRYPLCLILMELASQLEALKIDLDLSWRSRDDNVEADALTNHEFEGFSPDLRVNIDLEKLGWLVLPWLMKEAETLFKDVLEAKLVPRAQELSPKKVVGHKSSLRQDDPW